MIKARANTANNVTALHSRRREDVASRSSTMGELPVLLPIDGDDYPTRQRPFGAVGMQARAHAHMTAELRHRDDLKAAKVKAMKTGYAMGLSDGARRGALLGLLTGLAGGGLLVAIFMALGARA